MVVFTRPIETLKFKAVKGAPLPPKYNTASGRKYFREKYGNDVLMDVDYSNPQAFLEMMAGGDDLAEEFKKLKMLCDEQAKTIKDLRSENGRLRKQSSAQSSQ